MPTQLIIVGKSNAIKGAATFHKSKIKRKKTKSVKKEFTPMPVTTPIRDQRVPGALALERAGILLAGIAPLGSFFPRSLFRTLRAAADTSQAPRKPINNSKRLSNLLHPTSLA
nr:hypothetical protein [Candidatus Njordarchaeota archaeon]